MFLQKRHFHHWVFQNKLADSPHLILNVVLLEYNLLVEVTERKCLAENVSLFKIRSENWQKCKCNHCQNLHLKSVAEKKKELYSCRADCYNYSSAHKRSRSLWVRCYTEHHLDMSMCDCEKCMPPQPVRCFVLNFCVVGKKF